ncbi:MAG: error-prone DNA polymerase [Burkholderiales bacterium]|jgi:error-prone DNA polymerase|nr:error-prone DNA polymerase [Betaproteobacteria bacterium]
MVPGYAALNVTSNFTFLRGASHPEELVTEAARLNYKAIAITDECSVSGLVRAHVAAKDCGIQLIIGASFRIDDVASIPRILLLATSRDGYGNLSELITLARRRASKGQYQLLLADLLHTPASIGGCFVVVLPELGGVFPPSAPSVIGVLRQLKVVCADRLWLGYSRQFSSDDTDEKISIESLAKAVDLPIAATPFVDLHTRSRKPLLDALAAVHHKTTVDQLGFAASPNTESHLKTITRLSREYPVTMLLEAARIASMCNFSLDELRYEYPREVVPEGETPESYLRRVTYQGLDRRYGKQLPPAVVTQIEHELKLISDLKYEAYFLTIYDIVLFARARGILCQGRGSAANSAVCYCLGITEVDPARMQLLFERFISRERNEPPDIDVDFEHERREEVIQYLYEKYGRHRTALTAALSTYRPKGAIRDMGKALGLSLDQVDSLSRTIAWWDGRTIAPERLREAGFDPDNSLMQTVLSLTHQLIGFPRHLSQHSGGFVIARDLLTRLVPVENATMPSRTVIQWDKDDLDELGLLKVDILALGMLTALRKTIHLIGDYTGQRLCMQDIPAEDHETYQMIQRADTIGVFQIESRAQMSMLPRLKPATFYDLVIEVAIVRPGPIQGGMVHPYLKRRAGIEPVSYPSKDVEGVLKRTLGVSIFQEQVMQLAVIAAGFTPGEADRLRRAMAAWKRKGGIEPFRDQLISGMLERGYTSEYAEQIYRQMQGFGEYGFPESHAASFALLVYVSCYLKCHFPAAFACGLLNSQPLGFYSPSAIVQDVRRHGVEVLSVDVMMSEVDSSLITAEPETSAQQVPPSAHEAITKQRRLRAGGDPILIAHQQNTKLDPCLRREDTQFLEVSSLVDTPIDGHFQPKVPENTRECMSLIFKRYQQTPPQLRLGLRLVQGLSDAAATRIVEARSSKAFIDIADLKRRASLNEGDIKALAAADAFASLTGNRRHALWSALGTGCDAAMFLAPADKEQVSLRAPTEASDVVADYQTLGLTLRSHPVALLREKLDKSARWSAAKIRVARAGQLVRVAGIVTCRQRPTTASGTTFVTLEDETGYVNVIVWSRLAERQRKELVFSRLMEVAGTVEREGEVVHVVAGHLTDKTALLGALAGEVGDLNTTSRDFR